MLTTNADFLLTGRHESLQPVEELILLQFDLLELILGETIFHKFKGSNLGEGLLGKLLHWLLACEV
jgi:hypothetical protein